MSIITKHFLSKKDLRFLTLKGDKYQKIGKVSDLIRKISKTYYVVREANKKSTGYHFHALIAVDKEPRKAWYKKGVHMHLAKVGKVEHKVVTGVPSQVRLSAPEMTQKEYKEWSAHEPENSEKHQIDRLINKQVVTVKKLLNLSQHLQRVIQYMEKEQEFPAQYADYMLCVGSKQIKKEP